MKSIKLPYEVYVNSTCYRLKILSRPSQDLIVLSNMVSWTKNGTSTRKQTKILTEESDISGLEPFALIFGRQ